MFFKVYLFWEKGERERKREREKRCTHTREEKGQREERENPKQDLWGYHRAQCRAPTHCEIMTWAKIKSLTLNWQSHPGAPKVVSFRNKQPRAHAFKCIFTLEDNSHLGVGSFVAWWDGCSDLQLQAYPPSVVSLVGSTALNSLWEASLVASHHAWGISLNEIYTVQGPLWLWHLRQTKSPFAQWD